MVALNWQTFDLGVQINEAMFASVDDRSGYVLKPVQLRGAKTSLDQNETISKVGKKAVKFSVNIISAQQLPRIPKEKRIDDSSELYVEVEVFTADDKAKGVATADGGVDISDNGGASGLGAPLKRRTKAVKNNFFSPLWDEKMNFRLETRFESLVFIRFAVYSDDGSSDRVLRASYTTKLVCAAQGNQLIGL